MVASRIRMKLLLAFLFSLLLTSCAPNPEPILDEGTVVAKNASLRLKNSSTSRTIKLLDTGDKVDVLERQENWYRGATRQSFADSREEPRSKCWIESPSPDLVPTHPTTCG